MVFVEEMEEMGQISVSSVGWELGCPGGSVLALEWEMSHSEIPAVLLELSRLRALARQPREIKVGIMELFGLEGHSGPSNSTPSHYPSLLQPGIEPFPGWGSFPGNP